jgi:hypothetical protein
MVYFNGKAFSEIIISSKEAFVIYNNVFKNKGSDPDCVAQSIIKG